MSTTSETVIDEATRLAMYRMMQEARLFEKRAHDLFLEGLVKGTSHLALGQEAVAAGFAAALRPEDLVFCTYRGHVHTLLRGAPMAALMAELMGRASGICGGKGGSMHLTDVSHGAMGSYAIVGAHMPIAAGAAWAAKERDTGQVAVCFFGDGTTNIGAFHEALNLAVGLAAAGRLRVREQPLHGVHADRRRSRRSSTRRPTGPPPTGSRRIVVDGNDVDEVYGVAARVDRPGPRAAAARRSSRRRPTGTAGTRAPTRRSTGPRTRWRSGWRATRSPPTAHGCSLAGIDADDARPGSTREALEQVDRATEEAKAGPFPDAPMRSRPSCGPTEVRRGGTDLSRGGRPGDRPGDGARRVRVLHRRGRGGRRRRVQDDRGPAGALRSRAACGTRRSPSRRSSARSWAPR